MLELVLIIIGLAASAFFIWFLTYKKGIFFNWIYSKRIPSWDERLLHTIPGFVSGKKYKTLREKITDFVIGIFIALLILLVFLFTKLGNLLNKLGLGINAEVAGAVWAFFWWFFSMALAGVLWKKRSYLSLGIMAFWIIIIFLLVLLLALSYFEII